VVDDRVMAIFRNESIEVVPKLLWQFFTFLLKS